MHARVRTVARLAGVLLISAGVSTGACAQSGPSGGAIADTATLEVVGINYPLPTMLKADGLGSVAFNIYGGTARVAAY